MNIAQHLAATLKTLRQQRAWSVSRLAEETGVSKAMLGQIERNESSPTVATLWKIATGLNVPISAFLVPGASAAPSSTTSAEGVPYTAADEEYTKHLVPVSVMASSSDSIPSTFSR